MRRAKEASEKGGGSRRRDHGLTGGVARAGTGAARMERVVGTRSGSASLTSSSSSSPSPSACPPMVMPQHAHSPLARRSFARGPWLAFSSFFAQYPQRPVRSSVTKA
jgi:hypothetical protein